mgnify:CR=1 FL=1
MAEMSCEGFSFLRGSGGSLCRFYNRPLILSGIRAAMSCKSSNDATEAFILERPCVTLRNKLNDGILWDWVARFAIKSISILRADVRRSASTRVNVNIQLPVALIHGAIPAITSQQAKRQLRRSAKLFIAHVPRCFHCGAGSSQLLGRPRFTHRYCLPSSSSTVK